MSTVGKADQDKTSIIVQVLDNTGVRMFMYYPLKKTIEIPQKTCEVYQCKKVYENMPHSFAEDYVLEEDYLVFKEMYDKIDRGEKTANATFHNKDLTYCNHVTLTTISWTEDGRPKEVFGLIENWSELYENKKFVKQLQKELILHHTNTEVDEALKTIASSIVSQYFAVYYIWLETRTYICFQEQLEGNLSEIGEKGDYEPTWEQYITGCIEEENQADMRKFIEITTLADRIGHKSSISITYRRKQIGWTRGQFIVGKRDENGRPMTVIYTVSDINEEMESKIRREKAEQEILRDPLTKLWNRKAFEQYKEDKEYKNRQTGILLFDIDRFKNVNDQYGHEVGDRVIVTVGQVVRDILRQKDRVFRMGGDEFAVLLYDCSPAIWKTACRKIASVHENLKSILPAEMCVTISSGLCINEKGYCDDMYSLSDQAMYHTKANGRGAVPS